MKKFTSLLLAFILIFSTFSSQIVIAETVEDEQYSLNIPFYLSDQEARCFIGFLFNTKELTEEQLTNGNIYAFLTGQLTGEKEIESGFIFKDLMDAQLSRVVSTLEYGTDQGKEWLLDYLYLKAENTPGLAEEIINDTLHSIASRGLDYILDEYTIHGGPLQKMEYEYIQDGKLIKTIFDEVSNFPEKVDEYKKMVLALSGAAFYAGGTNRLEMYNYFLDMKSNMVYKYKYGEEYYDIVMSRYQYDEHYVVMRKIQPILANWEFLDEKMLLWATDERIALIEKWAEFAYLLEDGLSQFPQHNFVDEEESTTATTPSSTEATATQPTTTLPVIDETYYGITGDCMWELKTLSGILTITGNGDMSSYSSASSYPWYKYNGYIKQLIIKNGVKSIGSYAFSGCSGLTGTIEVPKSVQSIGYHSFYDTKPNKLILPFVGNKRGGEQENIGYIFSNSSNGKSNLWVSSTIKEIEITDETVIGNYAFKSASHVEKIKLNNEITSIGNYAFENCSSLISINIPESVNNIGNGAFYNCKKLSSEIIIPNTVTEIKSSTFNGCSSLETIVLPDTISKIGSSSFDECSLIKEINLTDNLESIGAFAFDNCKLLTNIYFGKDLKTIEEYAFNNCQSICEIKFTYGLETIGEYAFSGCSGLTGTIEVPKSVQSIGYHSFYDTKPNKLILPFVGNKRGGEQENIGYIFSNSSNGKSNLWVSSTIKEIEITDETVIGNYAFKSASHVEKIKLNNEITSIGNYAFENCSSLISINIPENLTGIGTNAFYGCSNLKDIYYPKSTNDWNSITFGTNNDILKTATIHFNYLLGDVNGDGIINIADATKLQKYIVKFIDFDDEQLAVADANGNGNIDIQDVVQIQKYLVGFIPSLG